MRVLEVYCGIGGCAAALPAGSRVVAAVDQNRQALSVYRHNFPAHPLVAKRLTPTLWASLGGLDADLWWLSPPCQPYTRRGPRRDAEDPRAASLLAFVQALPTLRPPRLAVENVPGFVGSEVHERLRAALDGVGYRVAEHDLCPSDLGWPNRRRRWYLTASLPAAGDPPKPVDRSPLAHPPHLADLLDPRADEDDALLLDAATAHAYRHALHVVERADPAAVTTCFTAAYGRSPVRSGSYLRRRDGRLRRFSPTEVLRLLGFPPTFTWPADTPLRRAWGLAGNSLSLPAVRRVLESLSLTSADGQTKSGRQP